MEAHAGGLEPRTAPWQPFSLQADMSLGAAAVALVDDRYGHSIEVAAVRLQVHHPQTMCACMPDHLCQRSPVHCKLSVQPACQHLESALYQCISVQILIALFPLRHIMVMHTHVSQAIELRGEHDQGVPGAAAEVTARATALLEVTFLNSAVDFIGEALKKKTSLVSC